MQQVTNFLLATFFTDFFLDGPIFWGESLPTNLHSIVLLSFHLLLIESLQRVILQCFFFYLFFSMFFDFPIRHPLKSTVLKELKVK